MSRNFEYLLEQKHSSAQPFQVSSRSLSDTEGSDMTRIIDMHIERATISMDGSIQGWNDLPVGLGKISDNRSSMWFTREIKFDSDGHGFWLFIKFCGFLNRHEAGAKSGERRALFTKDQVKIVKKRIGEFFLSEDAKTVFPFMRSDCYFLGTLFDTDCFATHT